MPTPEQRLPFLLHKLRAFLPHFVHIYLLLLLLLLLPSGGLGFAQLQLGGNARVLCCLGSCIDRRH